MPTQSGWAGAGSVLTAESFKGRFHMKSRFLSNQAVCISNQAALGRSAFSEARLALDSLDPIKCTTQFLYYY